MRYQTIEIRPVEGQWVVLRGVIDGDREEKETQPNALGFYHYPVGHPTEKAFTELRDLMIERHQAEINQLQESLDKLKQLELSQLED